MSFEVFFKNDFLGEKRLYGGSRTDKNGQDFIYFIFGGGCKKFGGRGAKGQKQKFIYFGGFRAAA